MLVVCWREIRASRTQSFRCIEKDLKKELFEISAIRMTSDHLMDQQQASSRLIILCQMRIEEKTTQYFVGNDGAK